MRAVVLNQQCERVNWILNQPNEAHNQLRLHSGRKVNDQKDSL